MATDFLVKQGKVMGGVRLVTDADVAHQTDLTNIIQTGTTSSQAISAGTYFYLNGTLVRAKVDIANGATFTLNTNYEVVTAGALNELNEKFNYSTTERVVGKWKDGRPIYEKTIDCGDMGSGTKNVAHNISNFDLAVKIFGTMTITSTHRSFALPYADNTALANNVGVEVTTTNVSLRTSADHTGMQAYVTVQYLKTS